MTSKDWTRYRRIRGGIDLLEAVLDRHVYDRHIHDTYAIGLTLRGIQRFWCRGTTYDSRPGNVIVIRPGESHDGRSGTLSEYAYRMFYVSTETLRSIVADAPSCGSSAIDGSSSVVHDADLFGALLAASSAACVGSTLAADQLIHDAFLRLAGLVETDNSGPVSHAALTRVREFLHDHAERAIAVDELAAIASMSRFRLTRQFQRVFGLPLHRYHLHVRLERAKHRLTAGTSIASVAADLGFTDQSHFHRRFKGAFGLTAAEWQRCTAIQDTSLPSM